MYVYKKSIALKGESQKNWFVLTDLTVILRETKHELRNCVMKRRENSRKLEFHEGQTTLKEK